MPNITLAMEEKLIEAGRRYARMHNTTLNALIRDLLTKTVNFTDENPFDALFAEAERRGFTSNGIKWTRDDIYDV